MISALIGELRRVDEDPVHLKVGPVLYEPLVPASDITELQASLGEELTFHTIFYLQGDASGGSLEPRLIGLLRGGDKRVFQKVITVERIRPQTPPPGVTGAAGGDAPAIGAQG